MKKIFYVAAALATIAFTSCTNNTKPEEGKNSEEAQVATAAEGSIVYFDLGRVLKEYNMANDLRSVIESKAAGIEKDVNRRGSKIEGDMKMFQDKVNKGLMTQSTAEVQYQDLQKKQYEFQNYAAKKQQEIQEELAVTENQIMDAIASFVKEYNADNKYAMIIASQGDIISIPVVVADESLDITNSIIEGLNEAYAQEKAKSNK